MGKAKVKRLILFMIGIIGWLLVSPSYGFKLNFLGGFMLMGAFGFACAKVEFED